MQRYADIDLFSIDAKRKVLGSVLGSAGSWGRKIDKVLGSERHLRILEKRTGGQNSDQARERLFGDEREMELLMVG